MISKRSKSIEAPQGTFQYIVQEKDTLTSLAAKYDVNLSLMKRVNKMMSDVIFAGQIIFIPNADYETLHKEQASLKPGRIERLSSSQKEGCVHPPRPLSNNEIEKLEEECYHKFIKIQASYITRSDEEVSGVLLITPDGVMFDPDSSNVVVQERGAQDFQMVDSIMSIISVTIYHDERALDKNLEHADLLIKSSKETELESLHKSDAGPNETYDASKELKLTERNQLKVYLKLKVHKNIHALKSFKVDNKVRSVTRLDHWFSIPLDSKVDQMYAFFKKWTPSMANASDSDDVNFVQVESDSDIAEIIDDCTDQNKEISSMIKKTHLVKDWEIVSLKEHRRLMAVVEIKKLPLPELLEPSRILKEPQIATLACNLPAMMEGLSWYLLYSTENHGFSLNTLFRKLTHFDSAAFLIIQDVSDNVFGAMVVGQIKLSDHFHGCGESYLFTFYPEFKRFNWTGINSYFVKGNTDSLIIGASEGNNGIWLDAELYHGRTQMCQTFDNELLSSTEDFVVKCLEVWSFK